MTEFEFRIHPVGPIVMGGMLVYPRERAGEVLRCYRDFIEKAPAEVGGGAALITAPPEEFVPEQPQGGAMGRTNESDVALNAPDAPWTYFCLSMWMDPAEDDQNRDWARGFAEAMRAYEVGTPYPNFIAADESAARLRSSYGPEKYERLVALKRQWTRTTCSG